jgi:V/A-type H+-transporting ATPase subunit A
MNESQKDNQTGYISAINGSLIEIKGIEQNIRLHDLVKITTHNILGEVIQIYSNKTIVQCYENTNNIRLNEKIINLGEPLSMELGPGLLSSIYDGIQRPLEKLLEQFENASFLERGVELPSLSRTKKWHFLPLIEPDSNISGLLWSLEF